MSDMATKGLVDRYEVKKRNGQTNPMAKYFVLRLDAEGSDKVHVAACQEAALVYAKIIRGHLPLLAHDLEQLVAGECAKLVVRDVLESQLRAKRLELNEIQQRVNQAKRELQDANKTT